MKTRAGRLEGIFSAMAEGVLLVDGSGSVLAANESAELILGLPANTIIGSTLADPRVQMIAADGQSISLDDHPATVTARTGLPFSNVVLAHRKLTGSTSWLSLNIRALDRRNTRQEAVVTFRDVTEERESSNRLQRHPERQMPAVSQPWNSFEDFNLHTANAYVRLQAKTYFGSGDSGSVSVIETAARHAAAATAGQIDQKFRALFRNGPDAMYLARFEECGKCIVKEVNSAFENLFGYSTAEMVGNPSLDRILDLDQETRSQLAAVIKSRGALSGTEYTGRRKDGSRVEVSLSLTAFDLGGELHVLGAIRDITAVRLVSDLLRQSEEKLSATFHNSPDALYIATLNEGRILAANQAFEKLFGHPAGSVLGRTSLELNLYCTPADRGKVVERLKTSGHLSNLEVQGRKRTGEVMDLEYSVTLVDNSGAPYTISSVRDVTSAKIVQRKLQESEERFSVFMTHLPARAWVVDETGKIVFSNRFEDQLHGLSPRQSWGESVAEAPGPEAARRMAASDQLALSRGVCESMEDIVDCEGNTRVFQTIKFAIPASGSVRLIGGIAIDITARQKAEEELKEAAQFAAQVIDSVRQGVVVYGPGLRYKLVNRFIEELGGVNRETLLGRHPLEFFPFLAEIGVVEQVERVLLDGKPRSLIASRNRPSDSIKWISDTYCALRNTAGEVTGVISTVRDITEEKAAEAKLQASESRYRAIFDNAPVALSELDLAAVVSYLDPVVRAGISLSEHFSANPAELVHCVNLIDLLSVNAATLRLFEARDLDELRECSIIDVESMNEAGRGIVALLDGQTFQGEVSLRTVRGKKLVCQVEVGILSGLSHRVLASLVDVTERKRAESEREALLMQLAHTEKMESIGRLSGGMAHDFNNLLTIINGNGALLLSSLGPDDPIRGPIKDILQAGQSAASITQHLLAFSRKQVMRPKVVSLNKVIGGILSMLGSLMGEDVQIDFAPSAENISVYVDPTQLEQVVMNLAVNARDAMPTGGRFSVGTDVLEQDANQSVLPKELPAGTYATLTVSDSGCGIDPLTLERIFEPFFTTKDVGVGTGLGLSLVQGIVEQSGGATIVASEVGAGTTFTIYLPASDCEAAEPIEPAVAEVPFTGGTVLVVEDQDDVRSFVCEALKRYGYRTIPSSTAKEAIQIWQREAAQIDLVLSDVVMPDLSGPALIAHLRASTPDLKALFISGYATDVIERFGFLSPPVKLIHKPFRPDELAAEVHRTLVTPSDLGTVLLADDSELVRVFMARTLRAAGYRVLEAPNAGRAQDLLRSNDFQIALLDLRLPDRSGLSLARDVRRDYPHVKTILMSGAFGDIPDTDAKSLGVDGFIGKPIEPVRLLEEFIRVRATDDSAPASSSPVVDQDPG